MKKTTTNTITITSQLQQWATSQPDHTAYSYLETGETVSATLSFKALYDRSLAIAASMQSRGAKGDRVLLLLPQGLDFITAFMGCLYAGMIAVPCYPPKRNKPDPRTENIARDSGASIALSTQSIIDEMDQRLRNSPSLKPVDLLAVEDISGGEFDPVAIAQEDTAFLQYTSGSTGDPKGVIVTHGNITAQLEYIRTAASLSRDTVSLTWLPHFHDMGLVDGVFTPIFNGCHGIVMPPAAFLQQPLRWLKAISDFGATHGGGPNFAYQLCVDKIKDKDKATLDLSTWKSAYNGAEPIRADTVRQFKAAFGDCGFTEEAFFPCYGMAETTLMVTGSDVSLPAIEISLDKDALANNKVVLADKENSVSVTLSESGTIQQANHEVAIVNPYSVESGMGSLCAEDETGEIWVSGDIVAKGYWQNEAASQSTFQCRLPNSDKRYLRTGDLGFIHNGRLFVTGRLKDVIIVRGKNYYPQDIEHSVSQCHPALRVDSAAAFQLNANDVTGGLCIVQEVERTHRKNLDTEAVFKAIRQAISQDHELEVEQIVLISPMSISKTTSGKIQRRLTRQQLIDEQLKVIAQWKKASTSASTSKAKATNKSDGKTISQGTLEIWLLDKVAEHTGADKASLSLTLPFSEYALSSFSAAAISGDLEELLGRELSPTILFNYPTIRELAAYLTANNLPSQPEASAVTSSEKQNNRDKIAVVGIGCRLPGADSAKQFWSVLAEGRDQVTEVPAGRWDKQQFFDPEPGKKGKTYTWHGAFIEDIDKFDAAFFNISPAEAKRVDPQQRLLLETSWHALEDAGINPAEITHKTGVFVGISTQEYSKFQFSAPEAIDHLAGTGNASSIAANRISYVLNLHGPSISLDTACSSSLTTLHLAAQSLLNGECDLALAGGVNLMINPELSITFSQAKMLSATGKCHTFDAAADGYVRGEGCGMVTLKRLSDAQQDGDRIYAVIEGSAINQDGRTNGLTAPNGRSQQAVIKAALHSAKISPQDISYFEAHGTGTKLGDPIELNALNELISDSSTTKERHKPALVGAVKTNIGHLESAAGVAGFIKTCLSLYHRQIPPTLHFSTLNPHIQIDPKHLQIATQLQPWGDAEEKLYAGVSSFGFGGSNAHIVLGSGPECPQFEANLTPFNRKSYWFAETAPWLSQPMLDNNETDPLAEHFYQLNWEPKPLPSGISQHLTLQALGDDIASIKQSVLAGGWLDHYAAELDLITQQSEHYIYAAFQALGGFPEQTFTAKHLIEQYGLLPKYQRLVNRFLQVLKEAKILSQSNDGWLAISTQARLDAMSAEQSNQLDTMTAEAGLINRCGPHLADVLQGKVNPLSLLFPDNDLSVTQQLYSLSPCAKTLNTMAQKVLSLMIDKADTNDKVRILEIGAGTGGLTDYLLPHLPADRTEYVYTDLSQHFLNQAKQRYTQYPFVQYEVLDIEHPSERIANKQFDIVLAANVIHATPDIAQSLRHICERLAADGVLMLTEGTARQTWLDITFGLTDGWWGFEDNTLRTDHPLLSDVEWQQVLKDTGFDVSLAVEPREKGLEQAVIIAQKSSEKQRLLLVGEASEQLTERLTDKDIEFDQLCLTQVNTQRWKDNLLDTLQRQYNCVVFIPALGEETTTATYQISQQFLAVYSALIEYRSQKVDTFTRLALLTENSIPVAEKDYLPTSRPAGLVSSSAAPTAHPCADAATASVRPFQVFTARYAPMSLLQKTPAQPDLRHGLSPSTSISAICGLAKVIALESPDIWLGAANYDDKESLSVALQHLTTPDEEAFVSFKQKERFVPRLEKIPTIQSDAPVSISPEGCYIIFGGTGAIGLQTAHYLASQNAGEIILVGRQAPAEQVQANIDQLANASTHIRFVEGDIACLEDIHKVFQHCDKPVKGIIHAAGVGDYQPLLAVSEEDITRVYQAKIDGCHHLINAIAERENQLTGAENSLDFLLLYSSMVSVWGAANQGLYVAANHVMDTLAKPVTDRQIPIKAPIKVINWCPIKGGGLIPEQHIPELAKSGIGAINVDQVPSYLARALAMPSTQVIIANMNWQKVKAVYQAKRPFTLFDSLTPADKLEPTVEQTVQNETTTQATPTGKLIGTSVSQRKQLIHSVIHAQASNILDLGSGDKVDADKGFFETGFDSLTIVDLKQRLESTLDIELPSTIAIEYPTLNKLAQYIEAHAEDICKSGAAETPQFIAAESSRAYQADTLRMPATTHEEPIAIVGMACHFPGQADSPQAFWELLKNEVDATSNIPESRWQQAAYYHPDSDVPGSINTQRGGFIDNIDQFDASFFNMPAREALNTDPQQRLLLETCYHALENAGIPVDRNQPQNTGVFVGISADDYSRMISSDAPKDIDAYFVTGNTFNAAAGRVAYQFGFHGPAMAIDSACSSSLVALHQAVQSLKNRECDQAVSAAANLLLSPLSTLSLSRAKVLSPEGRCKTFDATADGMARAEGCAAVVLKRLSDAERDNDPIIAVIKGSAVNQDGPSSGLTVPNRVAQEMVLRKALDNASIDAKQVSYVEAHGTGTPLGDPIELNALNAVYGAGRDKTQPLRVGSVKTNIGHTESVSGLAGLLKTAMSLQAGWIPAQLHYHQPTPHFDWGKQPIEVVNKPYQWPFNAGQRYAGVSSFGFSGTNAHVILTDAPTTQTQDIQAFNPEKAVLTLSAKTETALKALIASYSQMPTLEESAKAIAYSSNVARSHYPYRYSTVLPKSPAQLQNKLLKAQQQSFSDTAKANSGVVFLFTGQGCQYPGMGKILYAQEPVFRTAMDDCARTLDKLLPAPLTQMLFSGSDEQLKQTENTQPLLFALEYSLAQLWLSWGIKPQAVAGHSLGEYTAACIAGCLDLDQALTLVYQRGKIMADLPANGLMAAIQAPSETVSREIRALPDLAIACYNTPESTVISGDAAAMAKALARFDGLNIGYSKLNVSHAFHSSLMKPMTAPFLNALANVQFKEPQIPLISNLTAQPMDAAPNANYWLAHSLGPVKFTDTVKGFLDSGYQHFLEIGPHPVLSHMVQQITGDALVHCYHSMQRGKNEVQQLTNCVSEVYQQGLAIDWPAFHRHQKLARCTLPNYPFEHKRYWKPKHTLSTPATEAPAVAAARFTEGTAMSTTAITTTASDINYIRQQLHGLICEVLQENPEDIGYDDNLLNLGADSIILMEIKREIEKAFQVEVSLRQFFQGANSVELLAAIIADSPDAVNTCQVTAQTAMTQSGPAQPSIPTAPAVPSTGTTPSSAPQSAATNNNGAITDVQSLFERQLQYVSQITSDVVSKQLAFLKSNSAAPVSGPAVTTTTVSTAQSQPTTDHTVENPATDTSATESFWDTSITDTQPLTAKQQAHIDNLMNAYEQKTQGSKNLEVQGRQHFADMRTIIGFRHETKKICYPIVAATSQNAHFTDVDGNEYLDMCMGFGVDLFGHQPDFISQAINKQLASGMQVGPQSDSASRVAKLICDFTDTEKACFCNSGTEAVMTAIRLARAATGRNKIVMFNSSYHGHSDSTLALAGGSKLGASVPMCPGVQQEAIKDVIMLPYGNKRSLEVIRENIDALAAVVVEPVQSRQPSIQPKEFLHTLRSMIDGETTALIFDEMITGFRVAPGGAQEVFGVKADICTYGKLIGGGMPLGVVAGKKRYLDRIDGGDWQYDDDSYPKIERTFYAGTFCKHPLTMAASEAVLNKLKAEGPELQSRLNRRTQYLADSFNQFCEQNQYPIRLANFGSMMRFNIADNFTYFYQPVEMDLFCYHMISQDVYIWEGRTMFLSTAHTDADIEFFLSTAKNTCEQMRAGGFFPLDDGPNATKQTTQKDQSSSTIPSTTGSTRKTLPVTKAQQQLLRLFEMDPKAANAFKENACLKISGSVDIGRLENAIKALVREHVILGAVFKDEQIIIANLSDEKTPLQTHDVSQSPEPQAAANDIMRSICDTPFDYEQGPLYRFDLIKTDDEDSYLFISMAHIICDGWSMALVIEKLTQYGEEETSARARSIEKETVQWESYVEWLSDYQQSSDYDAHKRYWLEKITPATPQLALLPDFPRPNEKTWQGDRLVNTLDATVMQSVTQIAAAHSCSTFMLLLGAYQLTLHHFAQQQEVLVGVPVAGRAMPDCESMLGFCTHLIPSLSTITPEQPLQDYIEQNRQSLLQAFEHADYPFADLLEALQLPVDRSRMPLISATFNLDRKIKMKAADGNDQRLNSELVESPAPYVQYDISINLVQTDKQWVVSCDYNTALFSRTTIERIVGFYQHLLARLATLKDDQNISIAQLLSSTGNADILAGETKTLAPEDNIVSLFLQQVERHPNRTALVDASTSIDYQTLRNRVQVVAASLKQQGIQKGDLVGIMSHRHGDMVAGMLGVLACGAGYVPLDPNFPEARLKQMVKHAQMACILTERAFETDLKLLITDNKITTLFLEDALQVDEGTSPDSLDINSIDHQSTAYVIYTSGSTGTPKGIEIPHGALLNFLLSMADKPGITADAKLLAVTTISFDISILELFLPLLNGACTVIADRDAVADGKQLAQLLTQHDITHMQATPTSWQLLLQSGWQGKPNLIAMTGGEALPFNLAKALFSRCGQLFNLYGPTETTVWSATKEINENELNKPHYGGISIGQPIANTQLLILNEQQQPLPAGIKGELCIGGAGIAKGYFKQPELTNDSFVTINHQRVYRTGDLARHREDGDIEFLGRISRQIKLRGFRIEPGEIEYKLNQLPEIKSVVVHPYENGGTGGLAAYLVANADATIDAANIRNALYQTLPEYMVPTAFVVLDDLPLMPNGKINYNALPTPTENDRASTYQAAETDLQRQLVTCWQNVLKLTTIGIQDHFLHLGGTSLQATMVIQAIQKEFGLDLPIRSIFDNPTVASLAELIESLLWAKQQQETTTDQNAKFIEI